jgi:hypothetical protein
VGGTSASSPIIASTYALAGTPVSGTYPGSYPYASPASLNDVTSGSNHTGGCSPSYLCTAGKGYDGPTGLGTPNGTGAFAAPRPSITAISPTLGPPAGGTTVTLTGVNFSGATAVAFGTKAAASFTVVSGTSVRAVSPSGTGTVDITVTTPYGTSATGSADRFTYNVAPAITSADNATFTVGSPGTFTVTTTGSPIPALSKTGPLPDGVTFIDNGDGTATLAGTPASGTAGTYPLTIGAANGVGTPASQPFTLTVSAAPNPVLSGSFNAGGVPQAGGTVYAFSASSYVNLGAASVDTSGNYSISLPAGGYKLYLAPITSGYGLQWFGGADWTSATLVTVSGATTQNIALP